MSSKKNINKDAKATSNKVNQKVRKTINEVRNHTLLASKEVVQDVYEKSKAVGALALEFSKNNIEAIDVEAGMKKLRTTTGKINDFTLSAVNSFVENSFENTRKWQSIGEKAVKGSFEIAEKQQDMVFENLDTLKSQLSASTSRIKAIFSAN